MRRRLPYDGTLNRVHPRERRGGFIAFSLALILTAAVALGGSLWVLRERTLQAIAATQPLLRAGAGRDFAGVCDAVGPARKEWHRTGELSRPLGPMLRRLRWVPGVGTDLALLPDLAELAEQGTTAGDIACDLFAPVVAAKEQHERLALLAQQLSGGGEALAALQQHLVKLGVVLELVDAQIDRSPRLAPYAEQLDGVAVILPTAVEAIDRARQVGPQLPGLLGLDSPRRYLVVTQNPFELRPTGGFIGLVCSVRVEQARPVVENCRGSGTYQVPEPDPSRIPFPYVRYLRLPNWHLRDANWSPDFPTSARTLQDFWALNEQPAVDGVVAIDPFAFEPLLEAAGPLKLDDGSRVPSDEIVDAILSLYYDGERFSDREQLGRLLPLMLEHLHSTKPGRLPDLAAAFRTVLDERHILIALNDPGAAALIAEQGWDGRIAARGTDSLRIVDADVGYGDVNAFVERLTHYDVALDDHLAPLSATLTLTYTNRYSPWAEASTSHAVTGRCTNPKSLELGPPIGCYANYLRVYVPKGSLLVGITGVEESLGVDFAHQRTVFGGYFRLQPGEQRVIQIKYRLPKLAAASFVFEKQPGTVAQPLRLTAHNESSHVEVWSHARQDLLFNYRMADAQLQISGAFDEAAMTPFARAATFALGLAEWQVGAADSAVETWDSEDVFDLALDHARLLVSQGRAEDAFQLVETLASRSEGGRAFFELAVLKETLGDSAEVDKLYKQAAERSPDNSLAQLIVLTRGLASATSIPNEFSSGALRRWRMEATRLERAGDLNGAVKYLEALRTVTPTDRATALHAADLLVKVQRQDEALSFLGTLAEIEDVWGLLGAARIAEMSNRPEEAAAYYAQASPLAPSYNVAMDIGIQLQKLAHIEDAVRAFERAAHFEPKSIFPLLAAGNALHPTAPNLARTWYERAQGVNPTSGYPDYAVGSLLIADGDTLGALPYLESAVAKQPDIAAFRDLLHKTRDQLAPTVQGDSEASE